MEAVLETHAETSQIYMTKCIENNVSPDTYASDTYMADVILQDNSICNGDTYVALSNSKDLQLPQSATDKTRDDNVLDWRCQQPPTKAVGESKGRESGHPIPVRITNRQEIRTHIREGKQANKDGFTPWYPRRFCSMGLNIETNIDVLVKVIEQKRPKVSNIRVFSSKRDPKKQQLFA